MKRGGKKSFATTEKKKKLPYLGVVSRPALLLLCVANNKTRPLSVPCVVEPPAELLIYEGAW